MTWKMKLKEKPFKLYQGDCIKVMRSLPDNSVECLCTDPPYGLSFMGKKWDSFTTNEQYMKFSYKWAKEAFRILKPGGYLLSFSGTRTYHWMAVGIEKAGFNCRDMISWTYGCLDQDSEILTSKGWKKYYQIKDTTKVASWNESTGEISFETIEDHCSYQYNGNMVQFKHSNIDQLLTPNHRVYHRPFERKQINGIRKGDYKEEYKIKYADNVNRYQLRLPVSGIMQNGEGLKNGAKMAQILGWVWTDGSFDKSGTGVRIFQSNSANKPFVDQIRQLLIDCGISFKEYERKRIGYNKPDGTVNKSHKHTEVCFYISGKWAEYIRQLMPNKQPLYKTLWQMTYDERLAFAQAAYKGDGNKSQNCFNQSSKKAIDWLQALYTSIGYRCRYTERQDRPGQYSLYFEQNTEVELQQKHMKDKYIDYNGIVWCVTLKDNKAFVARRNNIPFITGNSGFPKSQNISKMIDKAGGVSPKKQAEILKIKRMNKELSRKELANLVGCKETSVRDWEEGRSRSKGQPLEFMVPSKEYRLKLIKILDYTKDERNLLLKVIDRRKDNTVYNLGHSGEIFEGGNTETSEYWNGYGTALKPCQEPVGVFQKPLSEGTIVANCLKWGTGGININAGRIVYDMNDTNPATNPLYRTQNGYKTKVGHDNNGSSFKIKRNGGEVTANEQGRWPGNFIHDGSPEVLACFPQSKDGIAVSRNKKKGNHSGNTILGKRNVDLKDVGYGGKGSAGRFFYCAKVSTNEREAGLEDLQKKQSSFWQTGNGASGKPSSIEQNRKARAPRANSHPTVKPIDLMRYLISVYCPHDGVVLDPFMGSGTTGIACIKAGKHFIGIEKDHHYCVDIANRRINHHFYYG